MRVLILVSLVLRRRDTKQSLLYAFSLRLYPKLPVKKTHGFFLRVPFAVIFSFAYKRKDNNSCPFEALLIKIFDFTLKKKMGSILLFSYPLKVPRRFESALKVRANKKILMEKIKAASKKNSRVFFKASKGKEKYAQQGIQAAHR